MAPLPTIDFDEVTWEQDKRGMRVILGRGAGSIVYAGTLRGQRVAMKAEDVCPWEEEAWMKATRLYYLRGTACSNVVAVHGIIVESNLDHDDITTTHYIVMERLAGTMRGLLLTRGATYADAGLELRLALLTNVANGLASLHAGSVISGDINPENVLLSASTPPVAKLPHRTVWRLPWSKTGTTTVPTTEYKPPLVYMDPLLFDSSATITMASDVYSFGIMAWEVLTGLVPFQADYAAALPLIYDVATTVLEAHVCGPHGKRPPLAALVERGVPLAIVAVVQSCWAPEQAHRPSMAAVHRSLVAAAAALPAPPAPARVPTPAPAPAPVPPTHASLSVPIVLPVPPAGSGSGGGGGSSGSGDGTSDIAINFDDVVWDRGRGGFPVVIGKGAFGIVYAGVLHGQPVAIKAEELRAGAEEAWLQATRLHMRATSPHIVAARGIIVDREGDKVTHYIVMERLVGTMTARLLTPGGAHYGADLALRLQLLADVASGLAYLHSCCVIHADIKPDNVLLSASTPPVAKLADFGGSVLRREGSKTRETLMGERGTLVFMDPRLIDPTGSIRTSSDVYSFGVLAWQVLSGLEPYEAEIMAVLPRPATGPQFVEALRRHVLSGGRPPAAALVERGVSPDVVVLVESCWAPAQGDRPTMADVQRALEAAVAAVARVPAR